MNPLDEVKQSQKKWGEGVVKIGQVYSNNGYQEAKKEAQVFIYKFYDYKGGDVLFKPTLASIEPFRLDFEGALSYFVGGNPNYPEDTGFALKPYVNVFWDNKKTLIIEDGTAISMGHYYFYDTPDNFTKVEYSFVYTKNDEGSIKIKLQHSSLPYNPEL